MDKSLGILRAFPEAGPVTIGGQIRRLVVPRTPLGIFYTVVGERVLVGAVLDLRQSPSAIESRMRQF